MKKTKKWLSLIPSCLLLFAVTSCVLAQGTYNGEKTKTAGAAVAAGQHKGELVYEISTQSSSAIFSKLDVSISQSRISYKYGKQNVKFVASLSKTSDFAEAVSVESTIEVGQSLTALQLSFNQKEEELEKLNTGKLFLKIEVVADESDETFDSSWVVLGNIRISGGEKIKGGSESEENVYLEQDFSVNEDLENVYEKENVEVLNGKLVPSRLGQLSYVIYELNTNDETNSFEKLELRMENGILKSKTGEKLDEEGNPVVDDEGNAELEEKGQTRILASVSSDPTYFSNSAGKLVSTPEGITSGTIDLSGSVVSITTPKIYVKVEFEKDSFEVDNPFDYLNVGKLYFVGEESKKVESYFTHDLSEGLSKAHSSKNMIEYVEKESQEQLVLKGKNKCDYITYIYNDDGTVETKKANVCYWTEKGIKYDRNYVSGLTEDQLTRAVQDLKLTASLDATKAYTGSAVIKYNFDGKEQSATIPVFVRKVADAYYELVFDLEKYVGDKDLVLELDSATRKKAYEYSSKVFNDFVVSGGGNVVYVETDGVRELYVHTGKALQRVSDLKTLRR